MSQEKGYLVDAVNYISYMVILQRLLFYDLCNLSLKGYHYCVDIYREKIWEQIRSIFFGNLLSPEDFRYLNGGNPQGVDYFFNNEPEQIIRKMCETNSSVDQIINELMNYELNNYDRLKKAYIEFVKSLLNAKLNSSSSDINEMTRLKQALEHLLKFVKNKPNVFINKRADTKVGTIYALPSDLDVNVSNPESWRDQVKGTYIPVPCNDQYMYVFPAPMFTDDFKKLIEYFLNDLNKVNASATTPSVNIAPQITSPTSSTEDDSTTPTEIPAPQSQVICSPEEIKKFLAKPKDPLEAATAYAFKLLGFDVKTNIYEENRAGQGVEIDVKASKGSLEIYVSCKNLDGKVGKPIIEQEIGRVNSLKKIPHLKVLVVSFLTDDARETAKSEGFLIIELNKKVTDTDNDLTYACNEIRNRLGEYFKTLAPPELVSAYRTLQETLNTLKNVEEKLNKVITALQNAANNKGIT